MHTSCVVVGQRRVANFVTPQPWPATPSAPILSLEQAHAVSGTSCWVLSCPFPQQRAWRYYWRLESTTGNIVHTKDWLPVHLDVARLAFMRASLAPQWNTAEEVSAFGSSRSQLPRTKAQPLLPSVC